MFLCPLSSSIHVNIYIYSCVYICMSSSRVGDIHLFYCRRLSLWGSLWFIEIFWPCFFLVTLCQDNLMQFIDHLHIKTNCFPLALLARAFLTQIWTKTPDWLHVAADERWWPLRCLCCCCCCLSMKNFHPNQSSFSRLTPRPQSRNNSIFIH